MLLILLSAAPVPLYTVDPSQQQISLQDIAFCSSKLLRRVIKEHPGQRMGVVSGKGEGKKEHPRARTFHIFHP